MPHAVGFLDFHYFLDIVAVLVIHSYAKKSSYIECL